MRRKKHKHTRRAVQFYKLSFGFHEPYKVLVDGNFIHATQSSNLTDLHDHIARLLGGRVKLYVTRCMTRELEDLGVEVKEASHYALPGVPGTMQALAAARGFNLHKCEHGRGECSAAACIQEQIGGRPGYKRSRGVGETWVVQLAHSPWSIACMSEPAMLGRVGRLARFDMLGYWAGCLG
ncbi:uncharacterized protein HaLaN_29590, partial [Haematococcus lacustris]